MKTSKVILILILISSLLLSGCGSSSPAEKPSVSVQAEENKFGAEQTSSESDETNDSQALEESEIEETGSDTDNKQDGYMVGHVAFDVPLDWPLTDNGDDSFSYQADDSSWVFVAAYYKDALTAPYDSVVDSAFTSIDWSQFENHIIQELSQSFASCYQYEIKPEIEQSSVNGLYLFIAEGTFIKTNGTAQYKFKCYYYFEDKDYYMFFIAGNNENQAYVDFMNNLFPRTLKDIGIYDLYPDAIHITADNFSEIPESELQKIDQIMEKYCKVDLVSKAAENNDEKEILTFMRSSIYIAEPNGESKQDMTFLLMIYVVVSKDSRMEPTTYFTNEKSNVIGYFPYVMLNPILNDGKLLYEDKQVVIGKSRPAGAEFFVSALRIDKDLMLLIDGFEKEEDWIDSMEWIVYKNDYTVTKLE